MVSLIRLCVLGTFSAVSSSSIYFKVSDLVLYRFKCKLYVLDGEEHQVQSVSDWEP